MLKIKPELIFFNSLVCSSKVPHLFSHLCSHNKITHKYVLFRIKNFFYLPLTKEMKDDRLPKIVLFGQPSGATRKAGRPCLGWEDVINKDLKEMGTSWEGVKREALNRLGWRRSVRSCVGLRRLGAAVSY